jgi:hypothetical protein
MKCCEQPKQEVENTMTTVNTERQYLVNRIRDIKYNFNDTVINQYHLYGDNSPKTYQELIDAIKNGSYTLDTKRVAKIDAAVLNDEKYTVRSPFDGIKWTLPGAPDQAGYNLAKADLDSKYQAAMDIIQTADAATGLKALQDFQAWSFTAPVAAPAA